MPGEYKLPEYTVYFDTNTAYSKKLAEPISARLICSIEAARKLTPLDVRIPEVVFEELIYQKFKVAKSVTENLKKNSKNLSDLCSTDGLAIPDDNSIEAGIRKQFEESAKANSFTLLSTPVDDIDWRAVVGDSCWRRPPFEKPKSEDDLAEKGFRDRIILETITLDISTVGSGVIAFVSADNLLRTTFKEQAESNCPVEVYCGFDEFLGHIELLAKTKSDEFTEEVLSKVAAVFYNPNDPKCLALSQGVIEHLRNEHSEDLSRPSIYFAGSPKYNQTSARFSTFTQPLTATRIMPGNWLEEIKLWTPVTPLKLFVSPPVFQPQANDVRYHWKSTITLVRLLRRNASRWNQPYELPEERIRTKDIDVFWSCLIDSATAFCSDYMVEEYKPTLNDAFVEADWPTKLAYDLFAGFDGSDA